MSEAVIKRIEEIFGDPEKFTPENMEGLVHETLKFFNDLKGKLESKDEKVRNEALQLANSLKTKLEDQAVALCKSIGMEPEALETYISNPTHFTPDQWQAMEKAKTELDDYKQEIGKTDAPVKSASKKKPKAVKEWLIG